MNKSFIQNKDQILSRLIESALKNLGMKNKDIDSFDPVMKLMLSGFAQEIHKVYHELENSNVRMLKQMSTILKPNYSSLVTPGHGILKVNPIEPDTILSKYSQFYTTKKRKKKLEQEINTEDISVFFSPLDFYRVYDCHVGAVLGNSFSKYLTRETNEFNSYEENLPIKLTDNELYIGIYVNKDITDLGRVNLYFDWRNSLDKDSYLKLLSDTTFSFNGKDLESSMGPQGASSLDQFEESGTPTFQNIKRNTEMQEMEVKSFYSNRFVSLNLEGIEFDQVAMPPGVNEKTNEYFDLARYNVYWIKAEFNPKLTSKIQHAIEVRTNCFPIINRKIESINVDIQNTAHIIPLRTHESFFFDLISVTDENKNHFFHHQVDGNIDNIEDRSYVIRESGIERFDKRDSKEVIGQLIDLIRDESAVFSAIGKDFLSNLLKELNQSINRLESQLKERLLDINNETHYLILKTPDDCRTIYADFWSSDGRFANGINQNASFLSVYSSDLRESETFLMTAIQGGRDKRTGDDFLLGLKRSIVTGDRLITKMDIKLFLMDEYQKEIESVEIDTGGMISKSKNEGFISTINVFITLKPEFYEWKDGDTNDIEREILTRLELKSPPYFKYQIILVPPVVSKA